MTLLDFPNKVACTVFTGGCNFRCPFCHNAVLVTEINPADQYNEEDVFAYLESRKGLLDGVAITGGEPLLQKDIKPFIQRVRSMGYQVKLDTNGSYPEKLKELVNEHLVDYVAVDIKNCKAKYAETVGVKDFDLSPVEETVSFLKEGKVDYEFRTTVVEEFHTAEDMKAIAQWIQGTPHYYIQKFVDSGNLIQDGLHEVDKETLQRMLKAVQEYIPSASVRG